IVVGSQVAGLIRKVFNNICQNQNDNVCREQRTVDYEEKLIWKELLRVSDVSVKFDQGTSPNDHANPLKSSY
ncbi:MAG: hypothetical protein ACK55Z_23260, partial [bacterium]